MASKKKSDVSTLSVTATKKYLDQDGLEKLVSLIGSKTDSMVSSASSDLGDEITNVLNALDAEIDRATKAEDTKQDNLTAGTGIEITSNNVINVTLDTTIAKVVTELPDEPAEEDKNKIFLVLTLL